MPKKVIEDMVRLKPRDKKEMDREVERLYSKSKTDFPKHVIKEDKKRGNSHRALWFVAFISLVFLFFALSFLFSRAKITLNPKTQDFTLNENLVATKTDGNDDLDFNLIAISGEETRSMPGGEKKNVDQKATGSVVIYNTYSSVPQSLDIETRLEGSNGKIYKTQTKTVIPGVKQDGTPGGVEVKIVAAESGIEYNSSPIDFKIFGFKGTPKYSKFYARSKGPISGGLKGMYNTISDADKAKLTEDTKSSLKEKLFSKAGDQIPAGFILFKDAVVLGIDEETTTSNSENGEIGVTVRGTMYGFLFKEESLTNKIVKSLVSNYDGSKVHIQNIRDLVFTLANKDIYSSYKDIQVINFKLVGTPKIVWDVDGGKLAEDVLGKKKSDFRKILLEYPNIDSADLVIRPIWKMSFPQKIKDIEVIVNNPINNP